MLTGSDAGASETSVQAMSAAADRSPALVMFVDDVGLVWLRPLRPGFRHCFVAVARNDAWIICNSLSHYTDLDFVVGLTVAEMAAWYCGQGFVVVETTTRTPPRRCAPIRPFTCVEAVKRILGLHLPWVLTPWQLHRFLTKAREAGTDRGIKS